MSPRGASLASYKGRVLRGVGLQFWLSDTYNFLGICMPQFSSWSKAEYEKGGPGTSSQPWNFMTLCCSVGPGGQHLGLVGQTWLRALGRVWRYGVGCPAEALTCQFLLPQWTDRSSGAWG